METEAGMKSISILGCGWLGKPLAVELIRAGYLVSGSTTQDNKISELESLGIETFLIQFDPHFFGADAYNFFQANTLIISIPPKRKSGQTDLYLEQMQNVVEKVLNGNIQKVVFISSTSVYADGERVVTEDDADCNSYLVQAENILREQTKFKTTVIRFGGLVGPDRNPGKFLAGRKDVMGGNHAVNIIHQQDCIGIIKAILEKQVWGEVFNACADHHPARKEFYSQAARMLNLEVPLFSNADESRNKVVNCDKIKAQLNYNFVYPDPIKMLVSLE